MALIVQRSKDLIKRRTSHGIAFYTSGQLLLEEYYALAVVGKAGLSTLHIQAWKHSSMYRNGSRIYGGKKLRVAVWSTGEELLAGKTSGIPDVNGPFLVAALREAGAEPTFLGALGALRDMIGGGEFEMVLTTGGVSVGKVDFLASSLGGLGAKTHFHGVAMRPGHPVLFIQVPGLSRDLPVLELPGNPGAAAACFRFSRGSVP
ncbi:hypothetical protein LX32DRAFT_698740 [Colletotrichum zoysiae]|uniref:MoaB/Mog domain-containing protein n=1 Tax=Colletotrichum zoysiae TaxID=1216348 RepID=A0AAD9H5W7_9PEZI|nr:hypothetical protein LX32DRAFT_698740 [Colletotrichum zoysiae]